MRPQSRVSPFAVLVLVAAIGACGDDPSQQTTGPYAVGTTRHTFVDDSRPTPAFGDVPESPEREVVTDIWYPAEGDDRAAPKTDAPAADGPFPLIVFNHGQQGEPQLYALSLEAWARAGYVVAAPRHPLTIKGGSGAKFVDDAIGEVGDVPFVISRVGAELGDLVDLDHVAVGGHSSGAAVAYGAGFDSCCHDDRIDAVLAESLVKFPFEGGEYTDDLRGTAVMFAHAENDTNPIDAVRAEFERAESPRFFMTVAAGDHSEVFRTGESAQLVTRAALDFFDYVLKGRDSALDDLRKIPGVEAEPD
jgi:fermentation-respiration switch protein FrsA (DUF1100 family)